MVGERLMKSMTGYGKAEYSDNEFNNLCDKMAVDAIKQLK